MNKLVLTIAASLSLGILAGCGGGGSSTPSASVAVSGKVADGYLVGATVFMDKNGNYRLDAGEPSATTDQNGAYTLNVDPADVGKYPIVAMAIKGQTVDMDTNAPVSGSYVLSMPAAAVFGKMSSNFISPMSSQLRVMMDTGNYATMQDAMNALSTQLGRPMGTNMLTDYVAASDTAMHTAAQNMATLMASQMNQVIATTGSTTTVDVGRYQGMMIAIFKNIPSIMGSGSNAQSAMTSLMSTMTTTLQGTQSGMPFSNISTSIRGMMGGTGSSTIGGMMGGTTTSISTGTGTGTTTTTGVMTGGTTTSTATGTMTSTGTSTGTATMTSTGTMTGTTTSTGTTTGGMM